MNKEAREPEPGYLLGGVLIAVLIVSQVAFVAAFGIPPGPGNELAAVCTGVYLQFIGLLVLAAYYFTHKTFLFRGIIWVCEHLSSPRGKRMAFFYSGLFIFVGTLALLRGLG